MSAMVIAQYAEPLRQRRNQRFPDLQRAAQRPASTSTGESGDPVSSWWTSTLLITRDSNARWCGLGQHKWGE